MKKITVKEMTISALMAALLCILAPWTVPIGPIPVSLASFVIYLTVVLLGMKLSLISVGVYLLLGLVGLPVFSGATGGVAKLAGPTGGFLIGYLFIAIVAGLVIDRTNAGLWQTIVGLIAATVVLYAFGTIWYVMLTGNSFGAALAACVYPFVIIDLVKIVVATLLGRTVRKALLKAELLS